MLKSFITVFIFFIVANVFAKQNTEYFYTHPLAIQKAIAQCPAHPPKGISCEQLEKVAIKMNHLALQLRMDPQQFGQDILNLQAAIAEQQQKLNNNGDPEIEKSCLNAKKELKKRLAVVSWLESPEA